MEDKKKVIVYVDGFNFYYGLKSKKWKMCYLLNGKSVQILTGVKAGDRVVTEGAYQVRLASASNAIPAHSHEH